MGWWGDYYGTIRDRDFVDHLQVAEAVRRLSAPDGVIAVDGDQVSIMHYLTQRVTVPLRESEARDAAAAAESIPAFVASRPDVRGIVVDVRRDDGARFRRRVDELMAGLDGAERAFEGERYVVYSLGRAAPPSSAPSP